MYWHCIPIPVDVGACLLPDTESYERSKATSHPFAAIPSKELALERTYEFALQTRAWWCSEREQSAFCYVELVDVRAGCLELGVREVSEVSPMLGAVLVVVVAGGSYGGTCDWKLCRHFAQMYISSIVHMCYIGLSVL